MIDPIMSYAGMMRVEIERMNSIAHNASNVNSDGFLQEKTSINPKQFSAILLNQKIGNTYTTSPDTKMASLRMTNRAFDVGISSNDWFQLESSEGVAVTRNGHFSLDDSGTLFMGGRKVMGVDGPITNLKPDFSVRVDGSIYSGNEYQGKIKLVSLSDQASLTPIGNSVYLSNIDVGEAEKPQVVQGALLASNVDIQSDMTKMIEMSRHIEMLQRAMTAYSSVLDVGINQIGK